MPGATDGYIRIKDAPHQYGTSRSTIDRRRDTARQQGDEETYGKFLLKTKDGKTFRHPSKAMVRELTKEGRVPEWYVAVEWLAQEFGKRDRRASSDAATDDQPAPAPPASAALAKVGEQYEARIADLKEQLRLEREERRRLLEHAQQDKRLFANAHEKLTQVLALPGIADAIKAQNDRPVSGQAQSVPPHNKSADPPGQPAVAGLLRRIFPVSNRRKQQQ